MGQRNSKSSYTINPDTPHRDSVHAPAKPEISVTRNIEVAKPIETNTNDTNHTETVVSTIVSEELSVPTNDNSSTTPPALQSTAVVPQWITEEYFIDILCNEFSDFKRISSFKALPALGPGENYATLMLRIEIDIELTDNKSEHVTFMLKVGHSTEHAEELSKVWDLFKPEHTMYFEVLPKMEALYKQYGQNIQFSAKPYKFVKQPPCKTVLLEDIRPRGFKNASRFNGLDMEHVELTLKKLAEFHAVSACLIANYGPVSECIMDNPTRNAPEAEKFFMGAIRTFQNALMDNLSSYDNGEFYRKPLENYFDNLSAEFRASNVVKHDDFNVINHGDFWVNNIMFSYDDAGKPNDVIFVDYQVSRYASPAYDLIYFILSSTSLNIKLKEYDHMIRYYHDHLIKQLKLMNYSKKLPTLLDLHIQLFNEGVTAVTATILLLPIVILEPNKEATFENFVADSDTGAFFKRLLFTNPKYKAHIAEILPWLYNRGLLEPKQLDARTTDNQPAANVEINDSVAITCSYPEWLNEDFLVDVVKQNVDNFQNIQKMSVSPLTASGDNYLSELFKIDINAELKDKSISEISFVLKVPPKGEQSQEIGKMNYTFPKEQLVYEKYLEKFENLYRSHGKEITFAPKCYKTKKTSSDKELILLENLRIKGFKNSNRLTGLDMLHTKAALNKLAEFHAASACYKQIEEFDKLLYTHMFTEENRSWMEEYGSKHLDDFVGYFSQFKDNEEYISHLKVLCSNYFDIMIEVNKMNTTKFTVLNHGDCWTNNILFQYDDTDNIQNTYFIDYQICNVGSPAVDLYYFILSSPKLEIKLQEFDALIRYYHEKLVENLKLLNYPKHIPTLCELHIDLLKYGTFGFYTVTSVLPPLLLDPTEDATIDNMLNNTGVNLFETMYTNPRYRQHAQAILYWLNRRGLLDHSDVLATIKMKKALVPAWIDKEHFSDVLAENHIEFTKINRITADLATNPGDNYASILLQVDVNVQLKDETNSTSSYMLKMPVQFEKGQAVMSLWNFFPKETYIYEIIIPAFEGYYKEAGKSVQFGPKVFHFKKDIDRPIIVMENLKAQGFKNCDRLVGLDMKHTKCVLKKLAQWHAASVKYSELNGPYPQMCYGGLYSEQTKPIFEAHQKVIAPVYMECVKAYEGSEKYFDKLEVAIHDMVDRCIKLNKPDTEDFNVLNHGDSWLNNIMFQYDEQGEIKETYYIDYQVPQYGSPVQDLYYFITTSTQLDIKVTEFDAFVQYYHQHLVEHMQLINCTTKAPTLEQLQNYFAKYYFYAVSTIFGVASICLLDPTENSTVEALSSLTESGMNFRRQMYSSNRYTAHASLIYNWLNERGYLDNIK